MDNGIQTTKKYLFWTSKFEKRHVAMHVIYDNQIDRSTNTFCVYSHQHFPQLNFQCVYHTHGKKEPHHPPPLNPMHKLPVFKKIGLRVNLVSAQIKRSSYLTHTVHFSTPSILSSIFTQASTLWTDLVICW